jgi:hypothetical protein
MERDIHKIIDYYRAGDKTRLENYVIHYNILLKYIQHINYRQYYEAANTTAALVDIIWKDTKQ